MSTLRRMFSRTAVLLMVTVFAWLVVLVIVDPMSSSVHGDGYYTWLWTRSMVFDRDVDFERDYQVCGDPWQLAHTPQGDVINQWNPGPSLFWIPILLFDIATHHTALDHADPRIATGCWGPLAERAVRGSLIAGLLTIIIAYVIARRAFGEGAALFGAIAIGTLTPLTYYATMLLSYGHAASAATAGLVVLMWDRERRRPSRWGWVWIGAATGLAMLTRPQNAIFAILPLCLWLERAWKLGRRSEWRALGTSVGWGFAYVGTALLVFAPQTWQWWDSQGELFFLPQGRHYMRWGSPRIAQVLFATSNGLLPWSPILYAALIGLGLLAWRRPTRSLGLPLLLVFAVNVYVNASVFDWWGAIGFPGRRFDGMSVPFAIGIAASAGALVRGASAARFLSPTRLLAAATVLVLGAWSTGSQVGVAQALRIDLPHRSDSMWLEVWGRVAHPLWEHVGNPLTWPASIPFALRYQIHPRAWDYASAPELFFHAWLTLERENPVFDLVEAHQELLVGFEATPQTIRGRRARTLKGEYGRALVPVSWPAIGALRISVSRPETESRPAHVWLALDDEDLGSWRVDPETRTFEVPVREPHDGITELRLRVVGGTVGFIGVELMDPRPSPAELEREHLREVAARRRAWRAARRGSSSE